MMKKNLFLAIVCVLMLFGCIDQNDIACTEEFRTVGVEITGKKLDSWYTIRLTTGDTFRIGTSFQNTYAILDDNFQKALANKQEAFAFHGVVMDSVWVKELYEISADACHINYVSGKLKIAF